MKINRGIIFVLILMVVLCFVGCNNKKTDNSDKTGVDTYSDNVFVLNISINPELELYIDSDTGVVIDVVCKNDDAEKLIDDANLDLKNLPYDEACETFIMACADKGYLNSKNNDITIKVTKGEASESILDEYDSKIANVRNHVQQQVNFEIKAHMMCFSCYGSGKCDLCSGKCKIVCTACNGNSGTPCEECGGDGLIPCPYCNGTGGCTACNKTGTTTCNKCGGAGGSCDWCHGSGTMECQTCHGHSLCEGCEDYAGSGYHHCNGCAGTGKTSCYRCSGTGYETCPRCNGEGVCSNCHGNKEINN